MTTATQANLISDRLQALKESATIAMSQKARELASQGVDVINLSLGEPDFSTPDYIREAAKKAIDEGWSSYPPVPGYPELRKAIANKLQRDNNIECGPDNIVVSTGAKQSIANVILSLVNPGDEVVIFTPYWVSYIELVVLAGGKPVEIGGTIDDDFKVTAQQLEEAITPKTKAIMYSSPCNPTGTSFTQEELEAIAGVVEKHPHITVIADEIYEYINFSENARFSMASIPAVKDQVVTVNGFSKGFAMTGWRLGYIAAPLWLAKACNKVQGQVTSGACSITQRAAITALEDHDNLKASTGKMLEAYARRRDLIHGLLKEIPGLKVNYPQGAFYIFPDVSDYFGKSDGDVTINSANDLALHILNAAHVSTVTGEAFGAPECIRISYATSDDAIKEAVKRIADCLAKLR